MRFVVKIVKWLLGLIVLAIAALFAWLYIAPPELIRVGSGYSAKIVCSNVFIAGRDANEVLAVDVQAPGHPLLRLMRVSVDKNRERSRPACLASSARVSPSPVMAWAAPRFPMAMSARYDARRSMPSRRQPPWAICGRKASGSRHRRIR